MEDKTRRLVLILEGIAIITALVLILVDYKLKNDLVTLYKKMEVALEDGRKLFGSEFAANIDLDSVRGGHMVDTTPTVETSTDPSSTVSVGQENKTQANGAATSKRSGRTRGQAIPQPGKPLGS